MPIISLSIPSNLLNEIDQSIEERGFASRSEIIRQAFRAFKAEDKSLQQYRGEIASVITVVFNKEADRGKIFDVQHRYGEVVVALIHSHVDEEHCLEVVVAKGDASVIRSFVNALQSEGQVAQVKSVVFERL
jgi:CopG family nickel-responsive transcriptional regulator